MPKTINKTKKDLNSSKRTKLHKQRPWEGTELSVAGELPMAPARPPLSPKTARAHPNCHQTFPWSPEEAHGPALEARSDGWPPTDAERALCAASSVSSLTTLGWLLLTKPGNQPGSQEGTEERC